MGQTNDWGFLSNGDSDEPGHTPSLISLCCALNEHSKHSLGGYTVFSIFIGLSFFILSIFQVFSVLLD